jgi:hypothetical protein
MHNAPIQKALERGIADCCKRLQSSNPSLLLTPQQLKATVRDVRYIPAVAAALACITCQSEDSDFSSEARSVIKSWKTNSGESDGSMERSNNANSFFQIGIEQSEIAVLGTLLEKQIRLACRNHAVAKKRTRKTREGLPARRTKRANHNNNESEDDDNGDEDDASVEDSNILTHGDLDSDGLSQEESLDDHENTPPRVARKKLVTPSTGRASLDSWSSRSITSRRGNDNSPAAKAHVSNSGGGRVLTRGEDDYEDDEWW